MSYYDRTCFYSSKDNVEKYKICIEIKNVLLPENYMFWTCFLFFGVLFTDCLIVYIILIALFMIWEQCLVLSTGKSVLRRKFHFAWGVRGFVNSAWCWGFQKIKQGFRNCVLAIEKNCKQRLHGHGGAVPQVLSQTVHQVPDKVYCNSYWDLRQISVSYYIALSIIYILYITVHILDAWQIQCHEFVQWL